MSLLLKSLEEAGYSYEYKVENCRNYGTPQDRRRVWLVAILNSSCGPKPRQPTFRRAMDCMQLSKQVPLKRLLLSEESLEETPCRGACRGAARRKGGTVKEKKKKVEKWVNIHRVLRRTNDLGALPSTLHPAVSEIQQASSLTPRETDKLTLLVQKGIDLQHLSKHVATVELKHNANSLCSVLVGPHLYGRSRTWTSTLLPGSRLLLLKEHPPRLLRGAEALALQGVPLPEVQRVAEEEHIQDRCPLAMCVFGGR